MLPGVIVHSYVEDSPVYVVYMLQDGVDTSSQYDVRYAIWSWHLVQAELCCMPMYLAPCDGCEANTSTTSWFCYVVMCCPQIWLGCVFKPVSPMLLLHFVEGHAVLVTGC